MKKRGDIVWNTTIGWIIAIVVFVLLFMLALILKTKGVNILEYIKDIARFG